ncbi:MAG: AsmA-like C-terminal domain-containing protein [Rhodospirillales bacterium]
MIRRTFRSVIQLIGVLGLGFAVFVGVLVWRLTTGPISLAFLTPYFESALKTGNSRFEIKLEDTILTWAGWDQSLDIRLRGAKAIGADGKVIAEIPELAVSLSGAALIKGELAPQNLTIFGPSLNIVRSESGKLELGLQNTSASERKISGEGLARQIIGELLSPPDMKRPLGYLRRIDIIGGNLTVDDRQLAVKWSAPETDIALVREGDNVSVSAELVLRAGDTKDAKTAAFTLIGNYDLKKKEAKLTLGFANLNPTIFARLSKKLRPLENFSLPLSGTVDTVVLTNGEIRKFEFNLTSAKGRIAVRDPIKIEVAVQTLKLRGDFDQSTGRLNVQELTLDLGKDGRLKVPAPINHEWPLQKITLAGTYDSEFDRLVLEKIDLTTAGPTLSASATVQEIGGDISFELGGEAKNLKVDEAATYWPKGWGDLVRDWVIQNLSVGYAPVSHARVTGRYSKAKGVEIISLLGDMDARNLTVDYLAPMPKGTNGAGRIKFDKKRFDIEITHGRSGDLVLRNGRVIFTGLDQVDQFMDVKLEIDGPLDTALKVIDSKPLEFAKSVGFTANNAKGDVSAKIALNFLLERKMTADTVTASASAILKNVDVPKVALGLDLNKADLILTANNKSMTIKGGGLLGGVETDIQWTENFADKSKFQRQYKLKAKVSDQAWREKLKFNFVPFTDEYMRGVIGAEVTANIKPDKSGDLIAKLDLKDTSMTLPNLGWVKSPKVAANAVVEAKFSESGFNSVPKIELNGGGMELLANASFDEKGKLSKVTIGRLRFGDTELRAVIAPVGGPNKNGWDIDVSGPRLDLRSWLAAEDDGGRFEKGDSLTLSLNVQSVQLYPGKFLRQLNGEMAFDGWVWDQIQLNSSLGGSKNFVVALSSKGGKRNLQITSNDAGTALQTFDYYDNLIGGRLTLTGEYADMTPDSKFSGHALIENFRVINAPVLAELLNVASVTGIIENLGGLGLAFAKFDVPFESVDDVITIKDASVTGLSLGLTASGTLNTAVESVDLKGTIVPAYALNTALTRIPIIGLLFSGGEKDGGVFAANYSMTGSIKDPDISTNPLSVLAPGILRRLFGIFDRPKDKKS